MGDYRTIRYRRDADIATLTLDRPGKLNAQNPLMWEELNRLGAELVRDESLRCLVVKGAGAAGGVEFSAIPVFHDESGGSERGVSIIFCWEMDGVKVCHLGDLGHDLKEEQVSQLAATDVLMIPVGGHFTIDAKTASGVVAKIKCGPAPDCSPLSYLLEGFRREKLQSHIAVENDEIVLVVGSTL